MATFGQKVSLAVAFACIWFTSVAVFAMVPVLVFIFRPDHDASLIFAFFELGWWGVPIGPFVAFFVIRSIRMSQAPRA
jgi:hypothetical protein